MSDYECWDGKLMNEVREGEVYFGDIPDYSNSGTKPTYAEIHKFDHLLPKEDKPVETVSTGVNDILCDTCNNQIRYAPDCKKGFSQPTNRCMKYDYNTSATEK